MYKRQLANYLSRRSRAAGLEEEVFLGEEKEWLIIYCKEVLAQKKINFFVFGHRPVSYTHLRAHETVLDLVCRLLLEKKKNSYISSNCLELTP